MKKLIFSEKVWLRCIMTSFLIWVFILIIDSGVFRDIWNMKKDNKDMLRRIKQEREKKVFVPASRALIKLTCDAPLKSSTLIKQMKDA